MIAIYWENWGRSTLTHYVESEKSDKTLCNRKIPYNFLGVRVYKTNTISKNHICKTCKKRRGN